MTSVTINGHTYTDDINPSTGMGNGGHRTRFIPALKDVVVVAAEVESDRASAATSASNASTSDSSASISATNAASSASSASTSASTATTQASNASTSATNASSSATAADGSASSASTSASTATTQATNAATSASDAAADAAAADADRITVAADKAIVAADKATVIADKAIVAADKATVAADKATTLGYKNDAATSAGNAATSETNAAASAAASASSASAAAAIVDLLRTVSSGLTATGSDQSGALALTTDLNVCTTVASGTGVKFGTPPVSGAKVSYVVNAGANPLKVYPVSGGSINSLSTNAFITLAVGGILEAITDTTSRLIVRTNQITDLISNGSLALGGQDITGLKTLVMNTPETITTTTGAVTLDFTLGSLKLQNELTGAVTYTFTAPAAYSRIQIFFTSDGTSTAYGITWPASVKWLGSAFTTTTANKAAMVNGFYDGTNYWMMGSSEV